jgi:hypothetical protein
MDSRFADVATRSAENLYSPLVFARKLAIVDSVAPR